MEDKELKDIREALTMVPHRHMSPDFQDRVRTRLMTRAPSRARRWPLIAARAVVATAAAITVAVVGLPRLGGHPSTKSIPVAGSRPSRRHGPNGTAVAVPAQYGPQLEGTILRIIPGPSTTVVLGHAQEVLKADGPFHHFSQLTIRIGPGRWVGPQHWQAAHDAMDLFIGEAVMAVPGHILATITGQPHQCGGIVRSIHGRTVLLQDAVYVGDTARGEALYTLMPQLTRFSWAPYSRFTWEGNGSITHALSTLKRGQWVVGLWEGMPYHHIIDQWTLFPSPSADGVVLSP